jgi:transposase
MAHAATQKLDLAAVRKLLSSLIAEGRADEALDAVLAMLDQLRLQNAELQLKLVQMRREHAGRRTEKLDANQLALMLEMLGDATEDEEDQDDAAVEEPVQEDSTPRQKPRRRRPPKELPREIIRHELSPQERECATCGRQMPCIGEDTSELLELVPAQFRVQEHHRAKYACPRCKDTVVTAPGPAKLIEKGLAAPSLLAHVVCSKYHDHLPLQRLQQIYQRGGVLLGVSTLTDWVGAVAEEVKPIVELIGQRIDAAHVLQTDGSGLKVLDRDHPDGIRKGTMWCCVGDRRDVLFRYASTGSGEDGPWTYLAGRQGWVQADASNVYDRLFNGQRANATEVGCWAHARRKLYALKDTDVRVAHPLQLIRSLYGVEKTADGRGLDASQRLALRNERSPGILDRLHRWLVRTGAQEPPESALAKACAYSLNHWQALKRFLEDGELRLDNNLCELQIRSLAVGRKNYLFAGSDEGAERAAILYSLLRTCALHGVNTYTYLTDVLQKLAEGWPRERMADLLPDAWAAQQAASLPAQNQAAA